jgi:ATP-binding cassette subfamily B protein
MMALANVIHAQYPAVLGAATDRLQAGELTAEGLVRYVLLLAAIAVGHGALFGVGQYVNHRLGRKFEFNARQRLFRHFAQLGETFFSRHGIGRLLSYVLNDVTNVRESIANAVNQMTNASVLLLSVLVMMAVSGIPPLLVAICVLPLLAIPFLVITFGPRIRERSLQVQEALAAMTGSAEEQIGGIRMTKTFAAEPVAEARFGASVERIHDAQLCLVRISALFQALLPFAGALSLVVALAFGGYHVVTGRATLGDFVALLLYLRMIVTPLQQIGGVFNIMQRASASLERLNRLLAVEPDIRETEDAAELEPDASDVEVRGLTFTYPKAKAPALKEIGFRVPRGKTLGIVGRTGSGKTTLAKLLLRVYDPPPGTVFIGGTDVRELTLESLRTAIAYVPQDGFLFSTTIRDNIAFSDRKMPLGKVEEGAKLAQLYETVAGFPEGFETRLGERGMTLSGGQRQRASLARGLVKNAPILVLDDSVSAVDAVTEDAILRRLREIRRGRTTIIISHRLSAVRHADEIVVLDDGRIAERGTHEELLRLGGLYAAMHRLQERGADDAGGKDPADAG